MPDFTANMNALMNGHLNLPDKDKEEAGGADDPKGGGSAKSGADVIPKPNYDDQKSRNQYLSKWAAKHGDLEGRGDHVLKVNEIPRGGSSTIKNISTNAAKQYGLSPSLLYASFMEEGGSELFKDKSGLDTKKRKPGDPGYMGFYGDKDYPINGNQIGLPDFSQRFQDLVKGGYLPKDFEKKFRGKDGEFSGNDFKTVEDGMKAKAAMLKQSYDEVDEYAKGKGIELSQKAKDFFALADFNSGKNFKKLLNEYQEKGFLEGDKFAKERPNKQKVPEKDDIYGHVIRRIKMADAFKQEQLFDQ